MKDSIGVTLYFAFATSVNLDAAPQTTWVGTWAAYQHFKLETSVEDETLTQLSYFRHRWGEQKSG